MGIFGFLRNEYSTAFVGYSKAIQEEGKKLLREANTKSGKELEKEPNWDADKFLQKNLFTNENVSFSLFSDLVNTVGVPSASMEEDGLTLCVAKVRELGTDFFRQKHIDIKQVFPERLLEMAHKFPSVYIKDMTGTDIDKDLSQRLETTPYIDWAKTLMEAGYIEEGKKLRDFSSLQTYGFKFDNSETALVDLYMYAEDHNLETRLQVKTSTRPIDEIMRDAEKLRDGEEVNIELIE